MFEKLWIYQMLDYERVLFIDADADASACLCASAPRMFSPELAETEAKRPKPDTEVHQRASNGGAASEESKQTIAVAAAAEGKHSVITIIDFKEKPPRNHSMREEQCDYWDTVAARAPAAP
jgi:hypothetical protein